jgi:hypothetical protein
VLFMNRKNRKSLLKPWRSPYWVEFRSLSRDDDYSFGIGTTEPQFRDSFSDVQTMDKGERTNIIASVTVR